MAKKSAFVSPKLVNPVIGTSKKSAKSAAGGGHSFKQGKIDNKFQNVKPTSAGGVTNAKPPKGNVVSEASMNCPAIGFGKGFKGAPVVGRPVVSEKKWGQEALKKADKPPSEGGTKGSLRKMMGKKKGEKISRSELKSIIDSPTASAKKKQKALAIYNLGGGKKK